MTSRTNPGGSSSTLSYFQGMATITDEEGRNTYQTWDAFGDPDRARLASVRNHLNQTWLYTYHGLGQLATVTAPGATTRQWEYNAKNRLASETHPESGTTTYSVYDNAGVLKQKADENGNQFVYQHDDNGRVTRITAGTRITNIGYELGTDNRISMSNGSVSTTFEYDQAGRLNHRRDIIGAYAFDTRYTYTPKTIRSKPLPIQRIGWSNTNATTRKDGSRRSSRARARQHGTMPSA